MSGRRTRFSNMTMAEIERVSFVYNCFDLFVDFSYMHTLSYKRNVFHLNQILFQVYITELS